jgi:hypothetical protein
MHLGGSGSFLGCAPNKPDKHRPIRKPERVPVGSIETTARRTDKNTSGATGCVFCASWGPLVRLPERVIEGLEHTPARAPASRYQQEFAFSLKSELSVTIGNAGVCPLRGGSARCCGHGPRTVPSDVNRKLVPSEAHQGMKQRLLEEGNGNPCRNGVGAMSLIVAAPKVGDVAEHGPPGQIARARSVRLELAGHVQVDLVLQDLLDHDGHVVATAYVHKRPGPPNQGDHPLLNQGGELETTAHLVDDFFFLQIIEHVNFFRTDQYQKTGYWRNRVLIEH